MTSEHSQSLIPQNLIDRIEDVRQRWGVKGVAISLVGRPRSTLTEVEGCASHLWRDDDGWQKQTISFGTRNDLGAAVDENSLHPLASCSKIFTALAVGLLINDGQTLRDGTTPLRWETKIKDILPDWKLQDQWATEHLDIIDLMSMRTGLPRHEHARTSRSALDEIKSLQYLKLSTEPRRDFQYNNLNYTVLAEIVTTLSGVSFTNFVKDRLFLPIGMNTATYDVPAAESGGRLVRGYTRSGRDLVSCRKKSLDEGGLSGSEMFDKMQLSDCIGKARDTGVHPGDHDSHLGSVGLMCSSLDLAAFLKELLDPIKIPGDIIKACATPRMVSDFPIRPETGIINYGLAQCLCSYRGTQMVGHDGWGRGCASSVFRLPGHGYGLAILINDLEYGPDLCDKIRNDILDQWLGNLEMDSERLMITKIFEPKTGGFTPVNHPGPPLEDWGTLEGCYQAPGYPPL